MLQESIERYARRHAGTSSPERSDDHWHAFAELGLLAAPFEEAYGDWVEVLPKWAW